MFDDEDPPCNICGKPACLVLDADTSQPRHFCHDHLSESWEALFRNTSTQPMRPCIVCGDPGEVRIIDLATVSLLDYCREHAPDEATELLKDD
jgi:hypothetical protein